MKEIRASLAKSDFESAANLIYSKCESPDFDSTLANSLAKAIDQVPQEIWLSKGFLIKKIAILSGYSAELIKPTFQISLLKKKIVADFFVGGFGLYDQPIYTRDAGLAEFAPDLVFFFVGVDQVRPDSLESESVRWLNLFKETHNFLNCEIIFSNFEPLRNRVFGNLESKQENSKGQFIEALNLEISKKAPSYVHLNDVHHMASLHGLKNWRDEKLYDMVKMPIAPQFWIAYAENLAAVIGAIFGRTRKCLILDLDNTLWGGVIGDDGLAGIKIGEDSGPGEGFKRFQTFIKSLKERGIILAVCSKNEEDIAKEPFLKHSEMVLKLEDISSFTANWEPKHENIVRIAKSLGLGLNAMVFVDDNPAECEIVRQNLPDVEVIQLPSDPSQLTATLSSRLDFETVAVTTEDLNRTVQYRNERQREDLFESIGNYDDYLRTLDMRAVVKPFDANDIPRITQLINKTNQFNLTTKRYSESDVRGFLTDSRYITRYVRLKDRFGDSGLISVFIGVINPANQLEIDTWLMSCRVLKRSVENLLFDSVLTEARARNTSSIIGRYIPTAKNKLVEHLLPSLGFVLTEKQENGQTEWNYSVEQAGALLSPQLISVVSAELY